MLVVGVSIAECGGADGAVGASVEVVTTMTMSMPGAVFRLLGTVEGRTIRLLLFEVAGFSSPRSRVLRFLGDLVELTLAVIAGVTRSTLPVGLAAGIRA